MKGPSAHKRFTWPLMNDVRREAFIHALTVEYSTLTRVLRLPTDPGAPQALTRCCTAHVIHLMREGPRKRPVG